MDNLLETIRVALAPDATGEMKAAGIVACRAILAELDSGDTAAVTSPMPAPLPIASIVSALRGVPPDQLLDLAITRLRAALPPGSDSPKVQPMKFHLIPLPRHLGPGGGG